MQPANTSSRVQSGRVLLTELGILAMDFPQNWIASYSVPVEAAAGNWYATSQKPNELRIDGLGLVMRIVDGPEVSSNMEIPRDVIWRNIRDIFDRFGIKAYVFQDKVESRGLYPNRGNRGALGSHSVQKFGDYLFGFPCEGKGD